MKSKVFLSSGTPFTEDQTAILDQVKKVFASEGLTLCQPEFSPKAPILNIRDTLAECKGLVAIAPIRYIVKDGLEKPGSNSQTPLTNVCFTTPWIHIETALAYEQGIPIMVIVDNRLKREGFLEHAHDWNVQTINYTVEYFCSDEFKALVQSFDKQINDYLEGKFVRRPAQQRSSKLTLGALITQTSPSVFVQLLTALASLLGLAFYAGKVFGKFIQ